MVQYFMNQTPFSDKTRRLVALAAMLSVILLMAIPGLAFGESLEGIVKAMTEEEVKTSARQLGAVKAFVIEDPLESSRVAIRKLQEKSTSERERAVWVWVLGLGGKPESVKHITAQVTPGASAILRANVDNALGEIGGEEAGKFLFREFLGAKGQEYKNHLLILMARAGYEGAIRRSTGLLELDMNKSRFKPAFFYGTMGRASVPFLIKKLDHWNEKVRENAAKVLGQWLLAKEAAKPLISRYGKEEDPVVRRHILDSLERTMEDLSALEQFMKKVEKEEPGHIARRFARESLAYIPRMRRAIEKRHQERKPDQKAFDKAYGVLYESKGREGDYSMLGISSDFNDEPALERLRGQILKRGVPESIFAAQKINRIILINRFMKAEGLE